MCCSWTRVPTPSPEPRHAVYARPRPWGSGASPCLASANSKKAGGPGQANGCLDASTSEEAEFATRLFWTLLWSASRPQGMFPDRILMRATQRTVSLVRGRPTVLYRIDGDVDAPQKQAQDGQPVTSTCRFPPQVPCTLARGELVHRRTSPWRTSSRVRLSNSCLALKASAFDLLCRRDTLDSPEAK